MSKIKDRLDKEMENNGYTMMNELIREVEIKIEFVFDENNFIPPYSLLIDRLCDFFTFDELMITREAIKDYYRVLVDLLVHEDMRNYYFEDRL